MRYRKWPVSDASSVLSGTADSGSQDAVSGSSVLTAVLWSSCDERQEKRGSECAPVSAGRNGESAVRYSHQRRRRCGISTTPAPNCGAPKALTGIVKASARPRPSIPSSNLTQSASLIRAGERLFQVAHRCAEQVLAFPDAWYRFCAFSGGNAGPARYSCRNFRTFRDQLCFVRISTEKVRQ